MVWKVTVPFSTDLTVNKLEASTRTQMSGKTLAHQNVKALTALHLNVMAYHWFPGGSDSFIMPAAFNRDHGFIGLHDTAILTYRFSSLCYMLENRYVRNTVKQFRLFYNNGKMKSTYFQFPAHCLDYNYVGTSGSEDCFLIEVREF